MQGIDETGVIGTVRIVVAARVGDKPGVAEGAEVQAQRIKTEARRMNADGFFFMEARFQGDTAACNCLKEDIAAMVLRKSRRDLLRARKARTAGPTGSSPAAPPGTSA